MDKRRDYSRKAETSSRIIEDPARVAARDNYDRNDVIVQNRFKNMANDADLYLLTQDAIIVKEVMKTIKAKWIKHNTKYFNKALSRIEANVKLINYIYSLVMAHNYFKMS